MHDPKYTALNGFRNDIERIKVYAYLNRMTMCDFLKVLLDDYVERNPDMKNLPLRDKVVK